jgi:predicted secreted Zn-dependent protease
MNIRDVVTGFCVGLALTLPAAAASAADSGVRVASIDPASRLQHLAQPVVTEKYEYYEIQGNCIKDLRSQMRLKGVAMSDGMIYDSVTSWHVRWDYGYDRSPQGCSTDNFRVFVDISFRFPKWTPGNDTAPALVEKWGGYVKHLEDHENGHRDLAVEAAVELSRAVAALPPVHTCAEIDLYVKALSRERMSTLNDEEKAYDATTDHGSKQGALFP